MILSSQTNSVYFSVHLANDYRQLYEAVKSVLQDYQIHVDVLCKTADYWCRDYMPIQVTDNTFVKYKYKPDYLNKRGKREFITNVDEPLSFLNLNDNKFINLSDITIDGGNVVKTPYHVLMTEKIFIENPQYQNKLKLIYRLEKAFQTEIIILPWCNRSQDKCGHTDGMVRFVKDKELLMADFTRSLISKEETKATEQAAKRAHKFNSKIDASVEIFKLGAPYWMSVYQALTKEELLSYGDCDFIRGIATYIGRGSLPTPAQCRRLLKIVNKAEDKGYIMP